MESGPIRQFINICLLKFIKEYLKVKEGVICNSPKSCFRAIFGIGIIQEEETIKFLEMTDDRNMTSHTYREEVAHIIFGKLKEYSTLMENAIGRFEIGSDKASQH